MSNHANTLDSIAVTAMAEEYAMSRLPQSVRRALKFAPFNWSATQFLAMQEKLLSMGVHPANVERALLGGIVKSDDWGMREQMEDVPASTYVVLGTQPLRETPNAHKGPRGTARRSSRRSVR